MDTILLVIGILALIVLLLLFGLSIFLFMQNQKLREAQKDFSPNSPALAVLNEKLNQLIPLANSLGAVQNDLRGLSERISSVEKNQNMVQQGVGHFSTNALSAITELKTLTTSLQQSTGAMQHELLQARTGLSTLHAEIRAEQENERKTAESIRRLETVIAGTQTKGSAGENVLELVFSRLPVEWQVRNFRIAGRPVEFALRLPNSLILPIDSKWTATNLLEQFTRTDDINEQQRIKKAIEETVLQKAREVRKYIDPSVTVNFGVAVLPDAIYDICAGIQPQAFQINVVLISYSLFIPYLLLVFQTSLKNSQSIDLQKLDVYLQTAQESIQFLQNELDGRFSRSLTMLGNSRDDMRATLGKISGSLTGLQMSSGTASGILSAPPNIE